MPRAFLISHADAPRTKIYDITFYQLIIFIIDYYIFIRKILRVAIFDNIGRRQKLYYYIIFS